MEVKDLIDIQDDACDVQMVGRIVEIYSKKKSFFEEGQVAPNKEGNASLIKKIRSAKIINLNNSAKSLTDVRWGNNLINVFVNGLNKYVENKKLKYLDSVRIRDIQLLKYEEGDHYMYHTDNGSFSPRTISCILLLNNDYEGGEISFTDPQGNNEFKVETRPGRLIVWPSNFMYPHKVNKVTKGTRYSIVAWAL